jgi:hypothetical protein
MEWTFLLALVIAIPLILFPAAFIWFLNVGGLFVAYRVARERRTAANSTAHGEGGAARPHEVNGWRT